MTPEPERDPRALSPRCAEPRCPCQTSPLWWPPTPEEADEPPANTWAD